MARTQAAEYDDRKLAIVESAAALFAAEGFNGASIADIAKRCGAAKSLVYHYYESKDDILYDVMISHVRALDEAARDATAGTSPPEQQLRDLAQSFMALYVGAANRHKVLLNDLRRLSKPRRAEIVRVQRRLIETVQGLLVRIQPHLADRAGESMAAAMLFFGAINWTHTWFNPKGKIDAEALADMAVDMTIARLERR
jgi:AcrR family transcriptional regulator